MKAFDSAIILLIACVILIGSCAVNVKANTISLGFKDLIYAKEECNIKNNFLDYEYYKIKNSRNYFKYQRESKSIKYSIDIETHRMLCDSLNKMIDDYRIEIV